MHRTTSQLAQSHNSYLNWERKKKEKKSFPNPVGLEYSYSNMFAYLCKMEYFEQFEKAYKFGNQNLHFENDTMPRIVERFNCASLLGTIHTNVSKIQQIGRW